MSQSGSGINMIAIVEMVVVVKCISKIKALICKSRTIGENVGTFTTVI